MFITFANLDGTDYDITSRVSPNLGLRSLVTCKITTKGSFFYAKNCTIYIGNRRFSQTLFRIAITTAYSFMSMAYYRKICCEGRTIYLSKGQGWQGSCWKKNSWKNFGTVKHRTWIVYSTCSIFSHCSPGTIFFLSSFLCGNLYLKSSPTPPSPPPPPNEKLCLSVTKKLCKIFREVHLRLVAS